jgi:CPA1 family monovalent cation:H+ antiporter
MDAETRQTAWIVWSTVLFWLNGLAFVLLGLQFPELFAAVHGSYSISRLAGLVAVVAGTVMILRMAWVFPAAYLPFVLSRKVRKAEKRPSWQGVFLCGWAGIRGTVTLAAALSIPLLMPNGSLFPYRHIVIFLALGVIAATLLIQGTTTEWLIRRLGLHEDGIRQKEDNLARTTAVGAGLKALRALESPDNSAAKNAALKHVLAEYEERLAELVAEIEDRRTHARARLAAEKQFRFAALEAERKAVDDLWTRDVITDEVHRPLQQLLDHEEAMLHAQSARPAE